MEWITVSDSNDIPIYKTIIVEDINGWIGQAYYYKGEWALETFGHGEKIFFDVIIRYIVLDC